MAQVIDAYGFIVAQPDIDHWIVKEDGHHISRKSLNRG